MTGTHAAACARTLTWPTILLLTALLTGCAAATGGGTDGLDAPATGSVDPPPPAVTNTAPVANAGGDMTVELPTDSAALSGWATDDGLPGSFVTYKWDLISGPAGPGNSPGATLADTNAAATSVRFAGGVGDYVLRFSASDGQLTGTSTLHVTVKSNPSLYPAPPGGGSSGWTTAPPADEHLDVAKLDEARDYSLAAGGTTDTEAGYVIRHGRLVYSWGNPFQRFEMKSTTASMGGLALLLALDEGKLALSDPVAPKLPVFGTDPAVDTSPVTNGSLADIRVLQLATHTAGFSKSDDKTTLQLLYTPGSTWSYSDQGLNWLADTLTQTYSQDLSSLLFAKIYGTLGIRPADLVWRDNAFRSKTLSVDGVPVARRELASGMRADVDSMARVGLLMLRRGVWRDQLLLSNAVVDKVHQPPAQIASAVNIDPTDFPGATTNYGLLWWTNATGQMAGVPKDAYWAWGLHETFIIVVPSLDLVIARAGDHAWHPASEEWNADYAVLVPFLTPIIEAVND
jgi:CubicO group peptidase (beta-lactamase class C family)